MLSGHDLLANSDDEEFVGSKNFNSNENEEKQPVSKLMIGAISLEDTNTNTIGRSEPPTTSNNDSGSIEIFIRAYEKRGDGINAYIVYKIETKVSGIPGYNKSQCEVWRRFSDFLGLRQKLVIKYQHQGIIVPLAPEKSISALTKTKLTEENNSNELADKRSRQLERFLRRIAAHHRLVSDCDVRDFLSFDDVLPKATFTSALSGTSMKKMFKSFGDVFNKLAFPMDENDRWFEQANSQVEELDEMLIKLQNSVENLVSYRRELSLADEQLCKSLSMLASCEENTALARVLSKLSDTHENLAIVERHESELDSQLFAEPLMEQLQLTSVLKEVFFERVKSWQNWQTQQQTLTRKREIKTRLDLAGKNEQANQCKDKLQECENKADQMEKDFLTMSRTIRDEYNRYCKQRREDIKATLIEYLESLIETEQRVLDHWERFAPETKTIMST